MKALIVGSGVGGGTVARELSKYGYQTTIIEKGPSCNTEDAFNHYDIMNAGTEISRTICIGGTTLVTAGNAVRTNQDYFKKIGIDLSKEFSEIEKELSVNVLPDTHFGKGTIKIMNAANSLGFNIKKMPKFIDPDKCIPCGKCTFGCNRNAKWTSVDFINDAIKNGTRIINKSQVTDIIVSNGKVEGIKCNDNIYKADIVILSAGAIETPRLLQKAGINAGNNLFVDTFITLGGVLKNIKFNGEVAMNAFIELEDIIIAPHYSQNLVERLKEFNATKYDILGMMIKIKDEPSGKVTPNEVIKMSTANDVALLARGSAIAGSILTQAGVDPKTLVSTHARGAHPGGTAAIGQVVNKNMETEVDGLYVADASVLPEAPGAPPILTIIALAKRLSKYLKNNI